MSYEPLKPWCVQMIQDSVDAVKERRADPVELMTAVGKVAAIVGWTKGNHDE